MTADPPPTLPDPRTADDDEKAGEAANDGRSATAPAEGDDDDPAPDAGSPHA